MQKRYTIKIYELGGDYIETVNPLEVMGDVRFTRRINAGDGECRIKLALPIDDFDEGGAIAAMNVVRIYERDDTFHLEPTLIYTGFVKAYAPTFENGTEAVELQLLGIGSLLHLDYLTTGGAYTVPYVATAANAMAIDIIAKFNASYPGNWIRTDAGTIDSSGGAITKTFESKRWDEALQLAFEASGTGGRYWRIAEDGQLWFTTKPATPTHLLTLGKHVSRGSVSKTTEDMVNAYHLVPGAGSTAADFTDAASVTAYGSHGLVESDPSITTDANRDLKGPAKIADSKDVKANAVLTINASYDIESIKPGDTITVNGLRGTSPFADNMMVTSVSYGPDEATVECERVASTLADQIRKTIKQVTG